MFDGVFGGLEEEGYCSSALSVEWNGKQQTYWGDFRRASLHASVLKDFECAGEMDSLKRVQT